MLKRPSLLMLSAIGRFFMVALVLLTLTSNSSAAATTAGRIYCQGTQLMVEGQRIYLNGANTPWHNWNEFGSTNGGNYDHDWWNSEFARMKAKGINSVRIWISCDGTEQPGSNSSGVTGVNSQFWSDVDDLMSLAALNQIYVMATMMSFNHIDPYIWDYVTAAHSTIFNNWLAVYNSAAGVQTILDNYIVPFVQRYKDNPYLFAIDLCNEPEWINETYSSESVANLQRYVAMAAAAIHKSGSKVLVSVGSASIKWNSEKYLYGNYWSNTKLQAQYNDNQAFLDFYHIHYYIWMEPYYPLRTVAAQHYSVPGDPLDRPLVMGEMPAAETEVNNGNARLLPVGETMASISEFFLANGYSGHYPWTSNGIAPTDPHYTGSLTDFGAAALAFQQAHPSVVILPGATTQTITFPIIPTQSWAGSNLTVALGATASSNLAITYRIASGPATVSGSTMTITGPGSVVVVAFQAGTLIYQAKQATQTITVSDKLAQSITFPAIPAQAWVGTNISVTLGATASSGLTVTYSVSSGSATVSGSALTIRGAGLVVVAANQSGNGSYLAAPPASRTVTVSKTSQSITFPAIANQTWAGSNPTVNLLATSNSGLSVIYSVVSGPASISGSTLTCTNVGTVDVSADQPGNANYQAAVQKRQTFTVTSSLQTQTITFPTVADQIWPGSEFALTMAATASSSLPVIYSVTGPATVSGSTVTITGTGTVSVTASQGGNTTFLPAFQVIKMILVTTGTSTPESSSSSSSSHCGLGSSLAALVALMMLSLLRMTILR